MPPNEPMTVEGTVVEVLPNTLLRVELPNTHRVLAHLTGALRREGRPFLPGERVTLAMTPFDLSRGRVIQRQK